MRKVSITFARGDDWEGFYVDDRLRAEGHSISAGEVFEWVRDIGEVRVTSYESKEVNLDWLDDCGSLPERLSDVVWAGWAYDRVTFPEDD